MKKSHVIFGYSTEDIVRDIELTAKEVTGRVEPKSIKVLVKKPTIKNTNYKRK